MRITRLETQRCLGGESPLWDSDGQALYFIDNMGQKIHHYAVTSGLTRSWDMPSVITALALRERGGAVVALRTGIHTFDFDSGALELLAPLADPPPFVFNDGKVDRRGRFLVGACTANFKNPSPDGGLYRLDPHQSPAQLDKGVYFSNGPCWSPDDRVFYFADSYRHESYAYDYDIATGEIANKRLFVNTRELGGMPDGSTVDRDGLVWIAVYGGGKIVAFRPDGVPEHVIDMPVRLVSSVTFGGAGLDQLYVTTIGHGPLGEAREEGGGDVYVVDGLGARGIPEPRYAG